MASSAKRERQLARERYERQQARRVQASARRRRNNQVVAVVVAVLLVVGGVVLLANKLGGDKGTTTAGSSSSPSTSQTPSSSPTSSAATTGCTYAKTTEAAAKKVDVPTYVAANAAQYKKPFTAVLKTSQGDITVAMAADKAPCTTNSFKHLATAKYFDATSCHRLTTQNIYVLQCGDPTGTGSGGPGYGFGVENAPADGKYPAGTVAMARTTDPNSNGSQFFLVYKDTDLPDATGYSIFGTVTKGLDVVQKVADAGVQGGGSDGKPATALTIQSVTIQPTTGS